MAVRAIVPQVPPYAYSDFPGYLAGSYYPTVMDTLSTTGAFPGVDTLYFSPWVPLRAQAPASIGLRITAGGTGSTMKVGIWAANLATMRPTGTPLVSSNSDTATTGTGQVQATISGWTPVPGTLYFVGIKATGTQPTVSLRGGGNTTIPSILGVAWQATATNQINMISTSDTYSNNIANTNVTAASWANVAGNSPAFFIGF